MRENLIPKDEAENPEAEYVTLDKQVIQRVTIVKAANVNDFNLENSGSRAREAHANTYNAKLFDLAKTAFGEIRLWVHSKPCQNNRDGHQALKLIWSNQLGVRALYERYTKNHNDIRTLSYNGENKSHNLKAYFLGHKKCHDVHNALVEQEFNDFTDHDKVTFLLDGIKCDMLDSVIYVVSGGTAHADFEAAQLMLDNHIRMLTEHSKFSNRKVLETYTARVNRPGCGDCRRDVRSGGSGILNGECDKRGISNGDHYFAVHRLKNIYKCWYTNPEYQKMNPLEKRRLSLNNQNQKKSSDWSERKAPISVNAVSITNSQLSEMSTSIAILATYFKNQDNRLKKIISKKLADKSDSDKFFSISEGESEGTNQNNRSLVIGRLKSTKIGRNK